MSQVEQSVVDEVVLRVNGKGVIQLALSTDFTPSGSSALKFRHFCRSVFLKMSTECR